MTIKLLNKEDREKWDAYVNQHPNASLYNLYGWSEVVQRAYRNKTFYFAAYNDSDQIKGILPLIHLKNFFFGNRLISIPYFDSAGLLADSQQEADELLQEAVGLATRLKVSDIELRQKTTLKNFFEQWPKAYSTSSKSPAFKTQSHKVRMVLPLPANADDLFKTFKSKLRAQIRRPQKSGLYTKVGGLELLDHFYQVFCTNMRDLGSPVHSKNLLRCVLMEFPELSKILVVYLDKLPVAGSLIVGFKKTLCNPWASSLGEFSKMAPNMLLYWSMLEFACLNGYECFDFGRSSPNEGTFRFKRQWGAEPKPIFWQSLSITKNTLKKRDMEKDNFSKAINIWKRLPVVLTKILGPPIRKNIDL